MSLQLALALSTKGGAGGGEASDVGARHTSMPMSPPFIDRYNRKICACGERNENVEMNMEKRKSNNTMARVWRRRITAT